MPLSERTSYQEQQLKKYFIEQVIQLGYPAVSVKSLTDAAGISRTSFYLFFSGKAELAEYVCCSYLETLNHHLAESMSYFFLPDFKECVMRSFDDIRKNADVIRCLWAINGESFSPYLLMQESMTNTIMRHISKTSKADRREQQFFAMTFSAAAMSTIKLFISNDCQEQEQIVNAICTCCFDGLKKLL